MEQQKKFSVAKDMLFVLSELSNYLNKYSVVNGELLDIIVQIMTIRNIHKASKTSSELLLFGVNCITNLIPKVKQEQLPRKLVDKVLQLFLHIESPKVRGLLAKGL